MTRTLPVKINKGKGSPIVLLPGLGNNHESWTYVLENFDYRKNKIIAVDLLGFGEAPKPKQCKYTVQDHANAVIDTLDELGIKDALISGHSMGALVAAEVASKRPDLAKNLVLLGAPLFKIIPRKYDRFKFWEQENAYAKMFRLLSEQKDLTLATAKAVTDFMPLIKGMEVTKATWPAFKKSLQNTILQTHSYETFCTLKTPTLLLYGALDMFVVQKNLLKATRHNKQYLTAESALGPHEITPVHGKSLAELLQK